MKVDGVNRGVKADRTKKNSRARKSGSASSGAKIEGFGEAANVEVADHAETLNLIRELVEKSPDVRVDAVDRIVREIRSGKYKINFEKVAEGFIKEAILTEMARKKGSL